MRKSPILKPGKSPVRLPLQDLHANTMQAEDTVRKKSTRRVSFAETTEIKEFHTDSITLSLWNRCEEKIGSDESECTTSSNELSKIGVIGLENLLKGKIQPKSVFLNNMETISRKRKFEISTDQTENNTAHDTVLHSQKKAKSENQNPEESGSNIEMMNQSTLNDSSKMEETQVFQSNENELESNCVLTDKTIYYCDEQGDMNFTKYNASVIDQSILLGDELNGQKCQVISSERVNFENQQINMKLSYCKIRTAVNDISISHDKAKSKQPYQALYNQTVCFQNDQNDMDLTCYNNTYYNNSMFMDIKDNFSDKENIYQPHHLPVNNERYCQGQGNDMSLTLWNDKTMTNETLSSEEEQNAFHNETVHFQEKNAKMNLTYHTDNEIYNKNEKENVFKESDNSHLIECHEDGNMNLTSFNSGSVKTRKYIKNDMQASQLICPNKTIYLQDDQAKMDFTICNNTREYDETIDLNLQKSIQNCKVQKANKTIYFQNSQNAIDLTCDESTIEESTSIYDQETMQKSQSTFLNTKYFENLNANMEITCCNNYSTLNNKTVSGNGEILQDVFIKKDHSFQDEETEKHVDEYNEKIIEPISRNEETQKFTGIEVLNRIFNQRILPVLENSPSCEKNISSDDSSSVPDKPTESESENSFELNETMQSSFGILKDVNDNSLQHNSDADNFPENKSNNDSSLHNDDSIMVDNKHESLNLKMLTESSEINKSKFASKVNNEMINSQANNNSFTVEVCSTNKTPYDQNECENASEYTNKDESAAKHVSQKTPLSSYTNENKGFSFLMEEIKNKNIQKTSLNSRELISYIMASESKTPTYLNQSSLDWNSESNPAVNSYSSVTSKMDMNAQKSEIPNYNNMECSSEDEIDHHKHVHKKEVEEKDNSKSLKSINKVSPVKSSENPITNEEPGKKKFIGPSLIHLLKTANTTLTAALNVKQGLSDMIKEYPTDKHIAMLQTTKEKILKSEKQLNNIECEEKDCLRELELKKYQLSVIEKQIENTESIIQENKMNVISTDIKRLNYEEKLKRMMKCIEADLEHCDEHKLILLFAWKTITLDIQYGEIVPGIKTINCNPVRTIKSVDLYRNRTPTTAMAKLVHQMILDTVKVNLNTMVSNSLEVYKVISYIFSRVRYAKQLAKEIEEISLYKPVKIENNRITVEFCHLKGPALFMLTFEIDIENYPNSFIIPKFRSKMGKIQKEILLQKLQHVSHGEHYITKLIQHTDTFLEEMS